MRFSAGGIAFALFSAASYKDVVALFTKNSPLQPPIPTSQGLGPFLAQPFAFLRQANPGCGPPGIFLGQFFARVASKGRPQELTHARRPNQFLRTTERSHPCRYP